MGFLNAARFGTILAVQPFNRFPLGRAGNWKDHLPIVVHADDSPVVLVRFGHERLAQTCGTGSLAIRHDLSSARFNRPGCVGADSRQNEMTLATIRVFDAASNVIETHEHKGDFKEW
jgi:hypothetical protein